MTSATRSTIAGTTALLIALTLSACADRRITITSDPPGATAYLNDVNIGRTPAQTDFTWFGTYDVRLELQGHDTLTTTADADAPIHEWPGIDILSQAIPPTDRTRVRWHFTLEPANTNQADILQRARSTRERLDD